ncbi:MAG: hypothetical protein ACOYM3_28345 [Terrimicrobiaceae bacterium]
MKTKTPIVTAIISSLFFCTRMCGQESPIIQIETVKIQDLDNNGKQLSGSFVRKDDQQLDPAKVKIHFAIYEKKADGKLCITQNEVKSKWLTLPTDWKDSRSEAIEVSYAGPKDPTNSTFYGYSVYVYYDGAIVDSVCVPNDLNEYLPTTIQKKK